jgi:ATP/maltotriose-dependent transcriptional regulator MalT
MPRELRRQSSPRSFDPSPRMAKRPALALVRRPPNATDQARGSEQPPSALLALRVPLGNAQAATVMLSSPLDDRASVMALRGWLIQSLLLEAITRDAFGDRAAAEQSLGHALDLARTDRVLRYLSTDLSTREIAGELYLSVHTIKTHVKHLYTKLDAHSRREAVRRARELGLLSHSLRKR